MRTGKPFLHAALIALSAAVLFSGCTSLRSRNMVIVGEGYLSVPLRQDTLVAHFRGYPGLSLNSVKVNLLYHSAEEAIRSGKRYLRLREIQTDAINQPVSYPVSRRKGRVPESAAGRFLHADGRDVAPHTTLTLSTSFVAEGIVELFTEPPQDDLPALDAYEVIRQVRSGKPVFQPESRCQSETVEF